MLQFLINFKKPQSGHILEPFCPQKNSKQEFCGALSCMRQFLATESFFKMMKNAFYFSLKALFIFTIFKFLS